MSDDLLHRLEGPAAQNIGLLREAAARIRELEAQRNEAAMLLGLHTARIRELNAALEWYADPERYRPHPLGIAFERRDISYVAVAALAAMKESDNGVQNVKSKPKHSSGLA